MNDLELLARELHAVADYIEAGHIVNQTQADVLSLALGKFTGRVYADVYRRHTGTCLDCKRPANACNGIHR